MNESPDISFHRTGASCACIRPLTSTVSHMRLILLAMLMIPSLAVAQGGPTCAEVTKALYGISLGSAGSYPAGLRAGLKREGTAELIADVGFESVGGKIDEIVYPRIMVFFDRGRVTGTTAIGRIESENDQGFTRIVAAVTAIANTASILDGSKASFQCEGPIELTVEPVKWGGSPAIKVHALDREAEKRTNGYIAEYCADPMRRRPQDACKK